MKLILFILNKKLRFKVNIFDGVYKIDTATMEVTLAFDETRETHIFFFLS